MQSPRTVASAVKAALFFNELQSRFDSLTLLGEQHGYRTMADLLHLQAALLDGGYIDAWPESKVLEVVDQLPSAAAWRRHISIYDDRDVCVHDCEASQQAVEGVRTTVFVLTSNTETGTSVAVCASRELALAALKTALAEYTTYDAAGPRPRFTDEEIAAMVDTCASTGELSPVHMDQFALSEQDIVCAKQLRPVPVASPAEGGRTVYMRCAVCGEFAGHWQQWPNQDRGWGLCNRCPSLLTAKGYSAAELESLYGLASVHRAEPEVAVDEQQVQPVEGDPLAREIALGLARVRISAHRGRRFRPIVDGISAGSWTAFQSDRGRGFSGIVDDGGSAQVIF